MTAPGTVRLATRPGRRAVLLCTGLLAGAALARLPFLSAPVSPDEGGFLLVASQWGPGSSLYGDYWVDRPPLLIAVFALADRLGGAVALRGLGVAAVLCAVLAAGAIGALVAVGPARPRAATMCAATAAVFLSTPLFGTAEVDGELLAAPLVLLGVALLLAALRTEARPARAGWTSAAGAAAAAAVLVKQNEWDVVVVLAGLLAASPWWIPARRVRVLDVLGFVAGAGLTGALTLLAAASRGTPPPALWDAVVVFRLAAAEVVGHSASPATPHRLLLLVLALVVSGAPLVLVLLARRWRCAPTVGSLDLRVPTVVVLVWEGLVVVAGASYWLHYLVVLVPGLVLAVAVLESTHDSTGAVRRPTAPLLLWAAAVCLVALAWTTAHPGTPRATSLVTWLRTHASEGDDAVIAYGQPEILQEAGLQSPYPDLWSLPVRVHDPRLHDLTTVLSGDQAPDWVVLTQPSLQSWGIDATQGSPSLDAHYVVVHRVDGYTVYHRAG